jgi:hypothetical protein
VVGEDLGAPRGERVAERPHLGHLVDRAARDRLVEQGRRIRWTVSKVDVAHGLLGQPGAEQLVVRVTDAQAEQHPVRAALVEPYGAGEQVGGHHLDPLQPCRIGPLGPSPQVSGAVAFDHVDHDVLLEVDQPGRVDGGVVPVGGQERGLVDAELTNRTDPGHRRAVCRAR